MNSLIIDIHTLITADKGDLWTPGKNLFGGREPASPDNCMTVFNAPGAGRFLAQSRDENSKGSDAYEYAGFQLRARSKNYGQAETQLNELIDILHGVGNQVVNGTLYTVIESLDSPFLLEWDESNRAKVVTNFAVQRTTNS